MSEASFRDRLTRGARLLGTFVKTPAPHTVEVLAGTGLDFLVLDAEHAPFDRRSIDLALLAARGSEIPALVRPRSSDAGELLAALDDGAAGVIVPHISSTEAARQLVANCRYAGRRGYSNSPRAGGYGARGMRAHAEASDRSIAIIAMIEDMSAVDAIGDILAVDGLDAIFIGRADLAVSVGEWDGGGPIVRGAVARIMGAALEAQKPVMMFASDATEAAALFAQGAGAVLISSDQGLLRAAARVAVAQLGRATGPDGSDRA